MDPEFLSALTLTIVPNTPLHRMHEKGRFQLPDITGLMRELRVIIANSHPSQALFRTNHASNYLPIGGTLPNDRAQMLHVIDRALSGAIPLRQEWMRGP